MEAMALGCVVLSTNEDSALEVIAHEYTGFLLPRETTIWANTLLNMERKAVETRIQSSYAIQNHMSLNQLSKSQISQNAIERV